jgi:hypothetical protein
MACVDAVELGTATGFVVEHESHPYLITNYHVAAGRNPASGQPMHSSCAVPTFLHVFHLMQGPKPPFHWKQFKEPVLDEAGKALWFEHPKFGRAVDVVALPLTNHQGAELHPYDLSSSGLLMDIGTSDGVNIIGFPYGLTAGGAFAIWTRGFVASEPDVDFENLPKFLVDSRTRSGQSGSPVIAYSTGGTHRMKDGGMLLSGQIITNLLGVYSGRINMESDLGIVWKVNTVREILQAKKPGTAGLDA